MRILLVDDSAVSRSLQQSTLAAQGYEVTTAANGVEGWALWQRDQQSVVVADWMMPGMDGLELCRRIRAQPSSPRPYFILQTVRSGGVAEAMEAGVDDFIHKPIVPTELVARVAAGVQVVGTPATGPA